MLSGCGRVQSRAAWVNDVHSRLTRTQVGEVVRPSGRAELVRLVRRALRRPRGISVAGGRHSMGSQAFGTGSIHFDLTGVDRVGDFDSKAGLVDAEPGVVWPELMRVLDERQASAGSPWCIVQKQTGADTLTLGGGVAANIHGRGLAFAPFVQDIESLTLLTAAGDEIECSREVHPDWFSLAIGGYGLFGVVTSLRLRLMRREMVRREVAVERVERIPELVEARIAEGCLYGDFQFSTATETDGFLRDGVFSVYRPVPENERGGQRPVDQQVLSAERWKQLITLAHLDKARAFRTYVDYYRTTDGQLYDSDRQQMSTYFPDYHEVVAEAIGAKVNQSLVITELYIPRERLVDFMDDVRSDMRRHGTDLVYGVVRWIEPDHETFLPWARDRRACVIFNLNVRHDAEGQAKAAADFRRLIDRALERGGSYYLTYHRHANRKQVEAAYPEFGDMLAEKERRDPAGAWNSDWYRHYRRMFGA
jgi:FAD/FMN-containing dehydrogenase